MKYYLTSILLVILVLGTYFLPIEGYRWIIWIVLMFIYIGLLIYGSINISSQFYVKTFCGNKHSAGCVAITFDDGPEDINTLEILSLLKKYSAKANFFVIGEKCELYPEIFKQIDNEGHLIGNHSFSHHNNFPMLSVKHMYREIERTQNIALKIINKELKYFRPPFGVTNPIIYKTLRKFNFTVIGWTIRTFDTMKTKEEVLMKIEDNVMSGDVILLHSTTKDIIWILEKTLKYLDKKKLKSVRIDEL